MLMNNSRYLDVEEIVSFLDPKSLEVKTTLGIRNPTIYKQDDTSRLHIVEVGDDLFNIAITYYGEASLWWVIADNNVDKCDDPFNLNVGDELFIPRINF